MSSAFSVVNGKTVRWCSNAGLRVYRFTNKIICCHKSLCTQFPFPSSLGSPVLLYCFTSFCASSSVPYRKLRFPRSRPSSRMCLRWFPMFSVFGVSLERITASASRFFSLYRVSCFLATAVALLAWLCPNPARRCGRCRCGGRWPARSPSGPHTGTEDYTGHQGPVGRAECGTTPQ